MKTKDLKEGVRYAFHTRPHGGPGENGVRNALWDGSIYPVQPYWIGELIEIEPKPRPDSFKGHMVTHHTNRLGAKAILYCDHSYNPETLPDGLRDQWVTVDVGMILRTAEEQAKIVKDAERRAKNEATANAVLARKKVTLSAKLRAWLRSMEVDHPISITDKQRTIKLPLDVADAMSAFIDTQGVRIQTQAEIVAEKMDNDGMSFVQGGNHVWRTWAAHRASGEPPKTLAELCREGGARCESVVSGSEKPDRHRTAAPRVRWTFPDGSAITVVGDTWDLGFANCFCQVGHGQTYNHECLFVCCVLSYE